MIGGIRFYSFPDAVEIYIDGDPIRDTSGNVAKTPLVMTDIPEGPHWVIFKMSGYFDEIKLVGVITNSWSDACAIMRPIPL